MIALTKSGYEKFIKGTLNLPIDTKVAILSAPGGETSVTNSEFTTSNINTLRALANSNDREYQFNDFEVVTQNSTNGNPGVNNIKLKAEITFDTMDFVTEGDVNICENGAVIDVTDSDDLIGMILLYPSSDPITYSALNDMPVSIDYRVTGLAYMHFPATYTYGIVYDIPGRTQNYSKTFVNGVRNLPIFNNNTQTNLLSDMKIALLSTTYSETNDVNFQNQLFTDSLTLSTLGDLDELGTSYTYISGGFTFRNLGLATDAGYPALTATDSTIYIPGLTIGEAVCFAVIYYEDRAVIDDSTDVMSDTYKDNSYLLNNVHNVTTAMGDDRFAFKQSVILDPIFSNTAVVSGAFNSNDSVYQAGIMALHNVVGPGFNHPNLNGELL